MANEEFIAGVLRGKLEWAEIDINIPDSMIRIIAKRTNNPGYALVCLSSILRMIIIKPIPRGYTLTHDDFLNAWPDYDYINERNLSNLWDDQKAKDGSNKIDTEEYWQRLVGYIL